MAIRVYPALQPVVNFRWKETPRLACALAKRVSGDNAVASHLLYGPMVDAEEERMVVMLPVCTRIAARQTDTASQD